VNVRGVVKETLVQALDGVKDAQIEIDTDERRGQSSPSASDNRELKFDVAITASDESEAVVVPTMPRRAARQCAGGG